LQEGLAVTRTSPILWALASLTGLIGFGATLIGIAIFAYATISHFTSLGTKAGWQWNRGIVWLSINLFLGGLILQVLSFVSRLALG
jgi:hypothetical protein